MRSPPILCFWLAAGAALVALGRGAARDDSAPWQVLQSQLEATIARAERSVVSIARVPAGVAGAEEPRETDFTPSDFGSGVILSSIPGAEDRYILTAAHVVLARSAWSSAASAPPVPMTILVRLPTRHLLKAELVAADPRSDLAVLALPLEAAGVDPADVPPLEFVPDFTPRKGQLAVVLGNPYAVARDGSASASLGMISNLGRRAWPPRGELDDPLEAGVTIHHYGTLLTIDARLQLGGSGGAVVDLDGRLIGLTTALAALEGYEKSAGYAVPMDASAQRIVDELRQGFEVEYGFLGIQPAVADAAALQPWRTLTSQPAAARLRRVVPGSPAEAAGLRDGDVVLAVGETPVYSDVDLVREVGWLGPDFEARLQVLRPEEQRILDVPCRLGKWPVYDDSLLVATHVRRPAWRGLQIDHATARRRFLPANPLAAYPQGVVAVGVDPGSPAAAAGIIPGTFIVQAAGREVRTPADFTQAISGRTGDVELELSNGRRVTLTE